MEIFTDASLNSTQKVAGVGMVFVPNREQQSDVMRLNTHFMTDNIEQNCLLSLRLWVSFILKIQVKYAL